ncbi:MAG: hypothetical protein HFG30_06860 [Eubacterium sp.]|nr:hypothetical protein [Eubacterium sp.]MCI9617492.1 hypothetical protein [Eubacterium sp.]
MNWRNKFTNFMYGRYGVDQFSRFIILIVFILCVLSMFIRTQILSLLILVLIVFTYYRMFSKNIYKRAAENEKYLQFISRFKRKNGSTTYNNTQNAEQKKYYKYFKCPGCSQKIRIPRGHGKIEIKCPKCNTKFIRKS